MTNERLLPKADEETPAAPVCRLCRATSLDFRGTKRGKFIDREFSFYTCRQCSFTQVEPITDFRIYDDAYYAGRGPDPLVNYEEEYHNHAGTPRRFEYSDLRRLAEEHLALAQPPATVRWLDYGCGAGGLLKFLRAAGPLMVADQSVPLEIAGHDVGSYAERLRETDGFAILDEAQLQSEAAGAFDIITCIEVVEHLPDPRRAIELLAQLLRPGGLLLLMTGNLDGPLARWQGIHFAYCIPEIHISLFTPRALETVYELAGLVPRRLRYDGSLRFRVLKNLPRLPLGDRLAPLANLSIVRRMLDLLFGVSAMPCAVRPPQPPSS